MEGLGLKKQPDAIRSDLWKEPLAAYKRGRTPGGGREALVENPRAKFRELGLGWQCG